MDKCTAVIKSESCSVQRCSARSATWSLFLSNLRTSVECRRGLGCVLLFGVWEGLKVVVVVGGGLRALRGVTRGGGVGGRRAKDLITDAEGYDV